MVNDQGNARIDIFNIGNKSKHVLITAVIEKIRDINKEYDVDEMVTLDGQEFVSLIALGRHADEGKLVFSEQRKTDFNLPVKKEVKTFKLRDYQNFLPKGKTIRRKKVVISYSKNDVGPIKIFCNFLSTLVDLEFIETPWWSEDIDPGVDWDRLIKHKFEEADIVFFMISHNFYNTSYIIEKEIPCTVDRYERDKSVRIIPIVLDYFGWERKKPYNLKRFSALPYRATPISSFPNQNEAWTSIVTYLRIMFEKGLDPELSDLFNTEPSLLQEKHPNWVNDGQL
jgi:hypothetical protein